MILKRRRPHAFERDGDRTAIRLGDDERSMLVDLAGQFRAVVVDDADPDLRRLYPTAYPDDPERDISFEAQVRAALATAWGAVTDVVPAAQAEFRDVETGGASRAAAMLADLL